MTTSRILSSGGCFSDAFLATSGRIFSLRSRQADKLYQSRVAPSSVNLLSEDSQDPLQVNLVSSCARSPKSPLSVKIPLSKRSLTPAPTSRSPMPPRACWFHMKHGEKALQETVFNVGKLAVRQMETPVQPAGSSPVASAPEEFCSSSLIFLKDILSDHEFLVDSRALMLTEYVC